MSPDALKQLIDKLTAEYGPIIGVDDAAKITKRKKQTIYDWSSRGMLEPFRAGRGGPIALDLDGFVRFFFKEQEKKGRRYTEQ